PSRGEEAPQAGGNAGPPARNAGAHASRAAQTRGRKGGARGRANRAREPRPRDTGGDCRRTYPAHASNGSVVVRSARSNHPADLVSPRRFARLFPARTRRALVDLQPVRRPAVPAALPHGAAGVSASLRPPCARTAARTR